MNSKMPTLPGLGSGYVSDSGLRSGPPSPGEKGYRRRKLAAIAGSMYRAGATAVNEIRESYAQTRTRPGDPDSYLKSTIPGAFPQVAITVSGDNQMIIFPSYAKRHQKRDWSRTANHEMPPVNASIGNEQYWRQEWERNEDEKAIVDVDVRGWVYSPHKGPMTRRNRILIGLARQLSGIPRPEVPSASAADPSLGNHDEANEELREQERIAKEAAKIEKQGRKEERLAERGAYSETPRDEWDVETESIYQTKSRSGSQTPISPPTSPVLSARHNATGELTEAELSVANENLMARIAPFMTTPAVQLPVTIFFYNDSKSQSRTVATNDAGHFILRAALDFVPTHVRVLARENLSTIQEIKLTEPTGISLISDVDDTIKRSNISAGAREIFRNTFVRELADLTVDGVKEWYDEMHKLGVNIHYCSNSPWQLFPVLASFFVIAGLPPGSLHLKQYSGMLQGIFEPVAERKKSTLNRLLRDFPEHKFLLVGDSGEADLEVYTELVAANPGRIIAVFIRDVTTPEDPGYFDSSFASSTLRKKSPSIRFADDASDDPSNRPSLPARIPESKSEKGSGPVMGTLIDLSDEPEEVQLDEKAALAQLREKPKKSASTTDLPGKKPPPRPAKPVALRSRPSDSQDVGLGISANRTESRAPQPPRQLNPSGSSAEKPAPHPLSQMHSSSQQTSENHNSSPSTNKSLLKPEARDNTQGKPAPPPPPPRRRVTPSSFMSLSPRLPSHRRASNSDVEQMEPLPPPYAPTSSFYTSRSHAGSRSGGSTPTMGSPTLGPAGRRVDLWRRRLQRAQDMLEAYKVPLYTWRTGDDVVTEAVGLVKETLKMIERKGKRRGGK